MDTKERILNDFLEEFWFAPQDAVLRAAETLLWSQQMFEQPILDIGCGDGGISRHLFSSHKKINMAIDPNPQAIKIARRSGVYKKVLVGDATKMPFKSKSFQTVVSNSTFEHIRNDKKAIAEVSRVLKKEGKFIFNTTTLKLKNTLNMMMDNNEFNKFNKRVAHFHYRSLATWRKILESEGLKIESIKYYFPENSVHQWYMLFKFATFRPYKRELWSYLKDSPYGKLVPKKLLALLWFYLLNSNYKNSFADNGLWVFIRARKIR